MSTSPTVPMFAPDGTLGDVPYERMHDALQAGGKLGVNVTAPDGTPGVVPANRVQDAVKAGGKIVPYNLEQSSASSLGETRDDIGNKIIVPKEGESFAETMNRVAEYGKTVTPDQITAQTKRGLSEDVPAVLAAAPAIGAVGAAGVALAPAAGSQATRLAQTPVGREVVKQALKGAAFTGGGASLYSLWKLLHAQ